MFKNVRFYQLDDAGAVLAEGEETGDRPRYS